jgi:putative ABC transport system permease protein
LRSLRRSPLFAVVAIGTMTLGIGATTTLFSMVQAVLLQSLPYREPARLVFVMESVENTEKNVSPANFLDWQRQAKSFTAMAAVGRFSPVLREEGEPEQLVAARVSANYFEILGTAAARGRTFVAEEDRPDLPPVVILSHDLWARRFGSDPAIVGHSIRLDDDAVTVIGVMPPGFTTPNFPFAPRAVDVWTPNPFTNTSPEEREARNLHVIARLKAGTSLRQAQEEMNVIAARLQAAYPWANNEMEARVHPMRDWLVRDVQRPITTLFAAVSFILLIACVNVAGLLTARGRARYAEMAMRRALGAGRVRLVRQLLTESLLLSVLGGIGGVLLALVLIPAVVTANPWALPFFSSVRMSVPVLLFAASACVLTGVLVGFVPALRYTNPNLTGDLASGARGSIVVGKIRGTCWPGRDCCSAATSVSPTSSWDLKRTT